MVIRRAGGAGPVLPEQPAPGLHTPRAAVPGHQGSGGVGVTPGSILEILYPLIGEPGKALLPPSLLFKASG